MYYQLETDSLRIMIQYFTVMLPTFFFSWLNSRHDSMAEVTPLWNLLSSYCPFRYSGWRMRGDGCRAQAGKSFLGEWDSVPVSSDVFLSDALSCTFPSIYRYNCAS